MVPFKLNYTVESAQGILNFTMDVDMLAHFDEWQRAGLDDEYEVQDQWPVELRRARVIPAVDYVQVCLFDTLQTTFIFFLPFLLILCLRFSRHNDIDGLKEV